MDLETENRIAAILMKEAAELRRQAEKDGVNAYLRQPNVRGRPNSRFLTATVLGVQQANRAAEVNEMWRVRQKEQELDDRLKRRRRDERSTSRSYREHEVEDRLKRKQSDESSSEGSYKGSMVNDRLKRRDEASSSRSSMDTDLCRSTNKRHADGGKACDLCSSSGRINQEHHLDEEGLKDDEIENFLNSRVKRGRGAVGSRMDETGPYLPPSYSNLKQLAVTDVASREKRDHKAILGPEKPSGFMSRDSDSSDEESSQERHKRKKKKSSSSKHTRKHKSKEKSNDNKKRNRKEERRHKRHR